MKQLITFAIVLFTLTGCSADREDAPEEEITAKEDFYHCTDFFDTGDYRSFCTIDTEVVNILDSSIENDGTVCKYIIPSLNNDVNTTVYFTSLATTELAKENYGKSKMESETSADGDSKLFHTGINVGDYEGYVSEARFTNYSKRITVQYKNVIVTTAAIYFPEWFPQTAPCNYDTYQLTLLMSSVLERIEK